MRIVYILLQSLLLTSCMVGPDFQGIPPPDTTRYTELPLPAQTVSTPLPGGAGKAQYFAAGQDIPAQWWTLFHSPELNTLIEAGLANSPTLTAAVAALQEAQQNMKAQTGALYPNITLNPSYSRLKFSGAIFGLPNLSDVFNLYTINVNVSYILDIFGGVRRQIEASKAQVDYAYFELEAAYLTLTSNIVTTTVTIAALRDQIETTEQLVQIQQKLLTLITRQYQLGGASQSDIFTQQTLLAQTRATLPPLLQNLAQSRDLLSVLVGAFPSESHLPTFNLNKLNLPQKLPISLPSALVNQRPDIREAEALVHQASALIGVAKANLLPQITLTGGYGWTSNFLSQLFTPEANIWNITAPLVQPIFAGGSLRAKKRAAVAAYHQAMAQYRQTVLTAFQNVSDTLQAVHNDAASLQAQRQAEIAALASMRLMTQQYRLGGASYFAVLTAQQHYLQTKLARIQAQASRFIDTAALFQALGGGWWNRGANRISLMNS